MAVVIPDGYAQVTLNWKHTSASREWSTVLGVQHDDALAGEIYGTVLAAWAAELQPEQDTEIELTTVTVRMGPSTGATPGLAIDFATNLTGSEGMAGTPANCALLVRKYSPIGGRANRGRNYWPGFINEASVNEVGVITSGALGTLQTAFTDFFALMGSGNAGSTALTPVVILHDEASPSTIPALVQAVSVDSVVGSQRRRIR